MKNQLHLFTKPAIAYTRTSTSQQQISHEAQLKAIADFCEREGLHLDSHFQDFASGTKTKRPGLMAAIETAKKTGSPILVLRIDRLSRSVAHISQLLNSQVQFVAVETGFQADSFVLTIMAAVAEHEHKRISKRLKECFSVLKAQGRELGQPKEVLDEARLKSNETCRAKGDATKARYKEIFQLIRGEGITSIRKTAERLETLNIPTPTGKKKWSLCTTSRMMKSL